MPLCRRQEVVAEWKQPRPDHSAFNRVRFHNCTLVLADAIRCVVACQWRGAVPKPFFVSEFLLVGNLACEPLRILDRLPVDDGACLFWGDYSVLSAF